MAIVRDDAVALMRYEFSETSQVLVLLTREHGKVRAIAKGIRRSTKTRFAVGIDLLDVGHVVLRVRGDHGEALAIVTEWTHTQSLYGLRETIARIHSAQYVAEITAQLLEDWDPHRGLYNALCDTLVVLTGEREPLRPVVRYQCRLVASVGSLPRFDACRLCSRKGNLTYFSSHAGGTICRSCAPGQNEKHALSRETRLACAAIAGGSADPSRPAGRPLDGAFSLFNYHIAHLMGGQPRLASKLVDRA